jgi:magnesium transporter
VCAASLSRGRRGVIKPFVSHAVKRKRRRIYRIRRRTRPGAGPGTVAIDPRAHPTVIDVLAYGPEGFLEEKSVTPKRIAEMRDRWPVVWIDVQGLAGADVLHELAEMFGLHPLVREDIVNVHQRPKVEEYDDHLFVVTRMVTIGEQIETEQLAIVLGRGFVATFQENPGDVLGPVRDRIRGGAAIRKAGPDHLVYALVDAAVDHYFPVLETYGERLEKLEDYTLEAPDDSPLARIHHAKHDLLTLRRAIWPQRDALAELSRNGFALMTPATHVYLRDSYDHCVQIIDLLETYRETAAGLLEVHLSIMNTRMNEAMKVLTIFATLFIPLTFIAGIYGMNFDRDVSPWNMPELRWFYGYPFALALMGGATVAILAFFRRRGWIGGGTPKRG